MRDAFMTLTEFLLARIAEDEAAVRSRKRCSSALICHTPTRLLAECEAKRRIVKTHEDAWGRNVFSRWGQHMQGGTRFALKCLAMPYADHPDYDEEWRP